MTEADADAAISLALDFEPKPQLGDMIRAVGDRRWTVYGGQRARLIADMLDRPMTEAIAEIAILSALETFLEQIRDRPADVARTLQKRRVNVEA